ncbi:type I glyceraldehyde-3-phosphate dehydrogenase [Candidatus Saccharibacteria bacterium]|nr:type I glyceraldehyde-3-phosphate dehydrogenase [Candidatus Saccharibacteria bacterium]
MSKVRVAINGFGRIGRNAYKILHGRNDVEVVAVNDLTDNKTLAHLLKYDSNYPGHDWYESIESTDDGLKVDGKEIHVFSEKDPASLPWGAHNVDVVIESTGFFVDPKLARAHIDGGGAKRVVISAPAKGEGSTTIILGVNDGEIKSSEDVINNGSCTTNCVSPVAAVMESAFGIEKALMSTIHSYTADQNLQDGPHKDLRRSRAAAQNIVPTSSGAGIAVAEVIPELKDHFHAMAFRVPTPVVSISDFAIVTKKNTTAEAVNEVFKKAAAEPFYQGILGVTEEPLVSSDFIGNSHSAIVDLSLTTVVGGNLVKVVVWYDNEWGYSNRLVELTVDVGKNLKS